MDFSNSPNQTPGAAPAAGTTAKTPIDHTRWKVGKFRAKPLDWGIDKTKEGLPQVKVLFTYLQKNDAGVDENRELTWFGSFKGGALERTMETLENLGLRTKPSDLESGRDGKALDELTEIEIVVEHRSYNGTTKAGIAWVNGGSRKLSDLEPGEAKALFAEVDAIYANAIAKSRGAAAKPANGSANLASTIAQPTMNESDLPF